MKELNFNLEFHGRRNLSSSRKNLYRIVGSVELFIGLFGLIKSNTVLHPFFSILTVGGVFSIAYGLIGKLWVKEKNYISIKGEEIEYKNSFGKPKKIKLNDLLDLRIETEKVEFVMNDQRVKSYRFSIFSGQELDDLYNVLGKIKADLVK